jgi:hypothetical protein
MQRITAEMSITSQRLAMHVSAATDRLVETKSVATKFAHVSGRLTVGRNITQESDSDSVLIQA